MKCYIASTEEEGQQCGQQMANDKAIVAVIEGPIVIGAESMFAALGDKPVIAGVSVNAVDTVKPSAAVLYGGAQYILAPYATFARDTLKAKSAALVYPEGAGLDIPAAGQASAFKTAGIPIKVVSYPANAPDLTVPLLAAGRTERRHRDAGHQPERLREVRAGDPAARHPGREGVGQPDLPDADRPSRASATSPNGSTRSRRRRRSM